MKENVGAENCPCSRAPEFLKERSFKSIYSMALDIGNYVQTISCANDSVGVF